MSYGWLSETTLTLKKPKVIKISDKSNEPLRNIIKEHLTTSKDKSNNINGPKYPEPNDIITKSKSNKKITPKIDLNKGVEERDKKDRELKRERGYKRVLAKKVEIYEKLKSGDCIDDKDALKIANNSLVDFKKKRVMSLDPEPLLSGGAPPCTYATPNVITAPKSNLNELRSKLAKIKQSKQFS